MTLSDADAPLLSLASGVLPEFTPEQTYDAASIGGWEAVGLWADPKLWTRQTTRAIRSRQADAPLVVLDVEVIWLRPGPDDPDHRRVLDIAAEIGARNALLVSSASRLAETADKLARLCEHALGSGVRLSLEFGAFTSVRSLTDALEILALCDREDAGLLVDPLHFARTGGRPSDLAGVTPSRFAYAQFCDAPATGPEADDVQAIISEALDGRLEAGRGELPLADLVKALPKSTPLSVELRSRTMRETWPDAADRARALKVSTQAWVDQAFKSPPSGL